MKKYIRLLLAVFILLLVFASCAFAGGSLLLKNARLIDGTGSPVKDGASILILNGRIAKIGGHLSHPGIPQLDVQGSYVLPGLIDGHVHLQWGPGAVIHRSKTPPDQISWEATWGKNIEQYLRAYLACGVTTVVDAGAPAFVIQAIRGRLGKGRPGPRFLTLGSFFSPPGGYVASAVNPPVATREDVEAKLNEMKALGAAGIKVPIEKGYNPFQPLPLHSPEILQAIKRGAALRNLPVYVHATTDEAFDAALDMEAHALMHTYIHRTGEQLSQSFKERMARANTYQVSTLSVMDEELTLYDPERLEEPLLKMTVPESELSAARDSRIVRDMHEDQAQKMLPWLPRWFAGMTADYFFGREHLVRSLGTSQKAIYDLHKAGVKIVMGSDTVYQSHTLYSFHGFTSLREMELLGEAGLSPEEAVKAATVNAAAMVGLDREIGTIEVGKCADLVVLKDNPLKDLRAFRTVRWTIQGGAAKTPQAWMRD